MSVFLCSVLRCWFEAQSDSLKGSCSQFNFRTRSRPWRVKNGLQRDSKWWPSINVRRFALHSSSPLNLFSRHQSLGCWPLRETLLKRVLMKCSPETIDWSSWRNITAFNHQSPSSHRDTLSQVTLVKQHLLRTGGSFSSGPENFRFLSFYHFIWKACCWTSGQHIYLCFQWTTIWNMCLQPRAKCAWTNSQKKHFKIKLYILKAWWCFQFNKSKI